MQPRFPDHRVGRALGEVRDTTTRVRAVLTNPAFEWPRILFRLISERLFRAEKLAIHLSQLRIGAHQPCAKRAGSEKRVKLAYKDVTGTSAGRIACLYPFAAWRQVCGEVSGIDLSRLDDAASDAVKAAWLAHKVLVFHDQDLDEDRLVDFARRLGEVEIHLRQTRTTGRREIMLVSNKKENGQPIGRLGNQELNWHMDQIFMAEPTAGTILYAVEVTPEGGDTWFCDLAAAYEALPPASRRGWTAGARCIRPRRPTAGSGSN